MGAYTNAVVKIFLSLHGIESRSSSSKSAWDITTFYWGNWNLQEDGHRRPLSQSCFAVGPLRTWSSFSHCRILLFPLSACLSPRHVSASLVSELSESYWWSPITVANSCSAYRHLEAGSIVLTLSTLRTRYIASKPVSSTVMTRHFAAKYHLPKYWYFNITYYNTAATRYVTKRGHLKAYLQDVVNT